MANSKKLIGYTGSLTTVSVPTAVNTQLVRQIASSTFSTTSVNTVKVDTYANDIQGAPWGANNVVWLKEPICTISFNANGGVGTMEDDYANVGLAYTIPQCEFVGAQKATFNTWAMDSISGSTINPGMQYAFAKSTELFALWDVPEKWFDNDKSTWAEANAEGWSGALGYVNGFKLTIDSNSTYNIPKTVSSSSITHVNGMQYKAFTEIGGKAISTIGTSAFLECSLLREVSFPNCTDVCSSAFQACSNLSLVFIPNCSQIEDKAFYGCSSLTNISIPNCSKIGWIGFDGCQSLSNVYAPNCSYVDQEAFGGCTNLQTINIEACSMLYSYTFSGCTNLLSISLPNCSFVSDQAFINCISLQEASLPICKEIRNSVFKNCNNLSQVFSPQCKYVGEDAFSCCYSLQSINLTSCSQVCGGAFYYCSALSQISLPVCINIGGSDTFASTAFVKNQFNTSSVAMYQNSLRKFVLTYSPQKGCASASDSEVTYICNRAFYDAGIGYISYPKCEFVGTAAFFKHWLSIIDMPKCSFVDYGAFRCWYNGGLLKSVNLPVCKYVGGYAFYNCQKLPTISLPECSYIGDDSFNCCYSLSTAYFLSSSSVQLGGYAAFQNCSSLTSIYVPSSMVDTYKSATNWSFYSSIITAFS